MSTLRYFGILYGTAFGSALVAVVAKKLLPESPAHLVHDVAILCGFVLFQQLKPWAASPSPSTGDQ